MHSAVPCIQNQQALFYTINILNGWKQSLCLFYAAYSLHREPRINTYILARHTATHDQCPDLVRAILNRRQPLQFGIVNRRIAFRLWKLEAPLGEQHAGANAVDADAGRQDNGQALDEVDLRGLSNGVGDAAAARLYAGDAGSGNKAALVCSKSVFRRVGEPEMGFDVHGEALVPVVVVDLLLDVCEGRHARPPGIGYHHVQTAHLFNRFLDEALH